MLWITGRECSVGKKKHIKLLKSQNDDLMKEIDYYKKIAATRYQLIVPDINPGIIMDVSLEHLYTSARYGAFRGNEGYYALDVVNGPLQIKVTPP